MSHMAKNGKELEGNPFPEKCQTFLLPFLHWRVGEITVRLDINFIYCPIG